MLCKPTAYHMLTCRRVALLPKPSNYKSNNWARENKRNDLKNKHKNQIKSKQVAKPSAMAREDGRRDRDTVAVLVEEREGLLEREPLLVRQPVHATDSKALYGTNASCQVKVGEGVVD